MPKESPVGNRRMVIIPITICGLLLYSVPSNSRALYSAVENFSPSLIGFALCTLYAYFYLRNYGKVPKLFCKEGTSLEKLITEHVPTAKTRYMPLYWLPESRCQTILRNLTPCFARFQYRREVVKGPDGGQFYMDWKDNSESGRFPDPTTRPTVLILPGITSTSKSHYIKSIVRRLADNGYRSVVMIYRGLDAMDVLTPQTYSATHTIDLEVAVKHLQEKFPSARLFAVGTSLGTLILSKYLADTGDGSGIDAAMLFSCPFNPPICAREVELFTNRLLINMHVAHERRRIYRSHSQVFDNIVDHEKVLNASHIREFDQHFTAPVFGYGSAEEYYEDCIIDDTKLARIRTPLLCVGSNDDPFSPEHGLPKSEVCESDRVALLMTYGGGHVSHLQGFNPFGKTYFEQVMLEYFDAALLHGEELHSGSL